MPAKTPSWLSSVVGLRCPRCRKGKLFVQPNPYNIKQITEMPSKCPCCGQDFVIEPGFYFGATYVSYALNIAWLVPLFFLINFILDLPYRTFVITMFVLIPILIPLISRLSRALWLGAFVKFDQEVSAKVEKQVRTKS
ncbi:MAG: DUF983 domain-containing protein [Bacteroidota bacterium]